MLFLVLKDGIINVHIYQVSYCVLALLQTSLSFWYYRGKDMNIMKPNGV
jgi:hypothetical protein